MKQYIHANYHHFEAQNLGVLNSLATRDLRISDENHLNEEKAHIPSVLFNNGYSRDQCTKAFTKVEKGPSAKKDTKDQFSNVHLSFIQGTIDKIARTIRKHNVASTFRPLNTIQSCLRSIKYPVDPKNMKGVYIIPCSCGTPTLVRLVARLIKGFVSMLLTSSMAGPTPLLWWSMKINLSIICIEEAQFVVRISHFYHRKLREALKIEKRPNNLNRDDGWNISRSWAIVLSS